MNITLSKQLKKKRREKGNTQEELAVFLGITTQAVSKWERDEGFPDITLLPAIASYYNISIDDLLGVGKIEKDKKLQEYKEKNTVLFRAGKSTERVALWREAKIEFPNDLSVLYDLMYALQAEDRKANADEIIEYGETILEESTDNSLRAGAIQSLCFTYYYAKGDAKSAIKYAKLATGYSVTVNQMMPRFLEGDEAVEFCQTNIQHLVDLIGNNTVIMCNKGEYSPEEKILALGFVIDCFDLLYPDGNCGFYHVRYSEFYEMMARNYLILNNAEQVFACLKNAAEHAVKYDTMKDGAFTAFMVNRVKFSAIVPVKDRTENKSGLLLKALQGEEFAHLQDHMRMQKIKEKLKKTAIL